MVSLASTLPYANAALFALQLVVTWFAFTHGEDTTLKYDTLVSPEPYVFSIRDGIYFFSLVTVVTDIAFPRLSIYHNAANPTSLRVCFALSCVLNAGWAVLYNTFQAVTVAAVDITLLWLVLLPIYLFLNIERTLRPIRWRQYVCSEFSIRLCFSWITAATIVSWGISAQEITGGYLSLASYLAQLVVLVVVTLVGVVYGKDPVIGFVAVWATIGITQKDPKNFPEGEQREKELRIQAAAALAAGVVASIVVVSAVEQSVIKRRYVSLLPTHQEDREAILL